MTNSTTDAKLWGSNHSSTLGHNGALWHEPINQKGEKAYNIYMTPFLHEDSPERANLGSDSFGRGDDFGDPAGE